MTHDTFPWQCPICGCHCSIGPSDHSTQTDIAYTSNGLKDGDVYILDRLLIRCTNRDCKKHYLRVDASVGKQTTPGSAFPVKARHMKLIARSTYLPEVARPLSVHVGAGIKSDYEEAFRIRELSPKASATLARRALQGMIREFWGVTRVRLHDELMAIEDKCDAAIYDAMMAVKSIGNIGAHPERDINLIVDIDPGEAEQLLELLQLLDEEWYVARAARDDRLLKMAALGSEKRGLRSAKPAAAQLVSDYGSSSAGGIDQST